MKLLTSLVGLALFAMPVVKAEIVHLQGAAEIPIPEGQMMRVLFLQHGGVLVDGMWVASSNEGVPVRDVIVSGSSASFIGDGWATYEFIPKRRPPTAEPIDGKARVILESSIDGVNWFEAEPGVYDEPGRLFRVRVTPIVTPVAE